MDEVTIMSVEELELPPPIMAPSQPKAASSSRRSKLPRRWWFSRRFRKRREPEVDETPPASPRRRRPSVRRSLDADGSIRRRAHALIVLVRIGCAWLAGALLSQRLLGSVAAVVPAAVLCHAALEAASCRGAGRRLTVLALTLGSVFIDVGDVRVLVASAALVVFPGWLLCVNAEAGVSAAVGSALLASLGAWRRFSRWDAALVFVYAFTLAFLVAPVVKRLVRAVRGKAWVDAGRWHAPETWLAANALTSSAVDANPRAERHVPDEVSRRGDWGRSPSEADHHTTDRPRRPSAIAQYQPLRGGLSNNS